MYVGELLPVVVLHDEIGFAFFNGPGRREAAGCHRIGRRPLMHSTHDHLRPLVAV